jgi:homoserine O-acetyltransferase/O-succinyltransferase
VVAKLEHGRYVVQAGTPSSPGHFTMTRPELWAQHVAEFMRWLGDPPSASN